jgi:hypothetical protein
MCGNGWSAYPLASETLILDYVTRDIRAAYFSDNKMITETIIITQSSRLHGREMHAVHVIHAICVRVSQSRCNGALDISGFFVYKTYTASYKKGGYVWKFC